jgi:tripartite ATP-independent transporter DctM subunit
MYELASSGIEFGWEIIVPVLVMLTLVVLAVRIWVTLAVGTFLILYFTDSLPLAIIGESLFDGVDFFALIAIPLFVLTGDVLVRTGLSNKLLNVAEVFSSAVGSGFGTTTVFGCGFFAAISGSDAAGAAAIGRITIDRLVEKGYPKPYAGALVAAGACTGILIPPSIAYIIIGLVLGISSSTLFKAAFIPGILILSSILITNLIMNKIHKFEIPSNKFTFAKFKEVMNDSKYALLIPFIILGGIYSGVFTPTEAGGVAAATALLIGFLQKTIDLSDIPRIFIGSGKVTGIILPIIALSLPLAQALAILEIPQAFVEGMINITDNPDLLLLLMIAIFVISGLFMETTPNIVILAPILFPLAQEIGIDDVHFCIIMISSLGVGFITPPLGLNLFVIAGISNTPILKIAWRAIPFVLGMLAAVLVIAFVPILSTWLL